MTKLRFWLIRLLAGDASVVLNVRMRVDQMSKIEPRCGGSVLVSGCEFDCAALRVEREVER